MVLPTTAPEAPTKTPPATNPAAKSPAIGSSATPGREGPAGLLSVLTRPSCRVILDGRSIGRSPILRRRIPAGRHRLRLAVDGHAPERRRITIRAGQLTQVNHSF